MGAFASGQVVVLPFPFSDLTQNKYRPALLVADVGRGDWIACQITSNAYSDPRAVQLDDGDFVSGSLRRVSFARPGKLFTASQSLFASVAGRLHRQCLESVRNAVVAIVLETHAKPR